MRIIKAIWFDLDNTLYNQQDYVDIAFHDIACHLAEHYSLQTEAIKALLQELWKTKGSLYGRLFDDVIKSLNLSKTIPVKTLITLFHDPPSLRPGSITPFPETLSTLSYLKKDYFLGIITNGNPRMQKRKLNSLGLRTFFDAILFANDIQPKPSEMPYKKAIELSGYPGDASIYVGDNPCVDFEGAKKAGYLTIRLLKGEFYGLESPSCMVDAEIKQLLEIINLLDKI